MDPRTFGRVAMDQMVCRVGFPASSRFLEQLCEQVDRLCETRPNVAVDGDVNGTNVDLHPIIQTFTISEPLE